MISDRFPYLPLALDVGSHSESVEALIDTGFDGDVALPADLLRGGRAVANFNCVLADGSEVKARVYRGRVRVGGLGVFPVEIIEIGDEPVLVAELSTASPSSSITAAKSESNRRC